VGPLSSWHGASSGCGWKSQTDKGEFGQTAVCRVRAAGDGIHCVGLLGDTGVELLEWRSSPAAATPTSYIRLKIRQKDQAN
jgi:hypothetical protein